MGSVLENGNGIMASRFGFFMKPSYICSMAGVWHSREASKELHGSDVYSIAGFGYARVNLNFLTRPLLARRSAAFGRQERYGEKRCDSVKRACYY